LDLKRSSEAVDSSALSSGSKKRPRKLVGSQNGSPTTVEDESRAEIYDLLVIGGGATGSGIALDAATRGLKVAIIERDDFASGTSSKSTKLVHGGVRYLEKAVWELDYSQYDSLTMA
jgi:glycerol-3-phosphate dehydrogenase